MAKAPTIIKGGVTFHIKAGEPSKSFTNFVKEYLEPAMRKQIVAMYGSDGSVRFIKDGKEMKYRMHNKYQDSGWMSTTRTDDYLETAIRRAAQCSEDAIIWGMTAVVEESSGIHAVEFPAGGGKPYFIHPYFEKEVLAALNQEVKIQKESKIDIQNQSCPDCTDGFYYPLFGPKEPCKTCLKS